MLVCLLNKMMEGEGEEILSEKEINDCGLGCALEIFTEHDEVLGLIDKLREISSDQRAVEVNTEKFVFILDKYQEQPHLLDPFLDKILGQLIELIRNKENPEKLKIIAFQYIKHIMKVRGYKVVVRHLPHEVSDLEPVLQLLESKDQDNLTHWEPSYVLLMWMSIIVKIPFHMSRLDSFAVGENEEKTVMERILNVCKNYIVSSSYFMIPAGFLTSHYITRSDIKDIFLNDFLQWIYKGIEFKQNKTAADERICLNSLVTLAAILKHGKREDLLPYAPEMLQKMLDINFQNYNNSLLRKYATKVIQRIGLTFLKPKVAAWRYKRGNRSLAENLMIQKKPDVKEDKHEESVESVEKEEFDVPEEVEEVIEQLMQGLKDSDTVIRWSAAKGIGRVTGRLPKELGDEVLGTVLELLNSMESDGAWHGGCLTLAELGRRGLLLPQRLPVVVPLILKALVYEESRGYYSIGDHVRDAACYVVWSFARAYDPEVLKPFVNSIASGLLIVTLFDREIKCRRAASAAFQENVGRQGTFPHGIEIVTTADYFSVGIRQNTYLKISVFVAQFKEYTIPLINHLIEKKVDHWDIAIRELTAQALHKLTPLASDYVGDSVLAVLLEKTKSLDLNCRHGSIIAIGEILHALKLLNKNINPEHLEQIRNLISFYREKRYFSGVGGEIMRQGFCYFIQKCALSKFPFHELPVIDELQSLMDECLRHEVPVVRAKAVAALPSFFEEYYQKTENGKRVVLEEKCDEIISKYMNELTCYNEVARLGYATAIGEMPRFMLIRKINELILALLESLKITEMTLKWAECRRDSIKALVSVVSTVGLETLYMETEGKNDLSPSSSQTETSIATTVASKTMLLPQISTECRHLENIFKYLLIGLGEYTNDIRGDIGAWVRQASMSGLEKMVIMTAKWNKQFLDESLMASIIGGIAQQAVERIDRTRFHAGKVFSALLHHKDPIIPFIPYREELLKIFPEDVWSDDMIWKTESETFPRFVRLLSFPCYTHNIMEGLILSIGGLTERLVKHSSASLFSFLKSVEDFYEISRICDSILHIFHSYLHNNRVIVPLFTFLDRLLGSGVIRKILEDENSKFAEELLRLTMLEIGKVRDYRKFVNSMDVLCQLVQVKGPVCTKALSQMSVFLCYKLKAVRKVAAYKLYECMLLYGDCSSIPEENVEEIMDILSETNWELEPQEIRPIRNKLCELMNIKVPKLITKS